MKEKETKRRPVKRAARRRATRSSSQEPSLQSEQILATILESTTEGYWEWRLSTGEVYYGTGWLSSLGYAAGDLSNDDSFLDSVICPDDLDHFKANLKAHLSGESPTLDCECRLREKSGRYRWFRMRGKVLQRDTAGNPLRVVGTVLDIHCRKRAQADLARSQAQLEAILASTDNLIWSVDSSDFALTAYNKAFEEVVSARGIRPRLGLFPEQLAPPDRAHLWRELYAKVLEQGKLDWDQPIIDDPRILHVTAQCLQRDGVTFGISLFGHDVTERKRMQDALRTSEEKFHRAFMESPMAITITSARDHRYLEVNGSFERAVGYQREEVIGKTPFDINLWVDPELRRNRVETILQSGRIRDFEFQYRRKDGEIRDALGCADLIEIDSELCLLSSSIDITDRKRAQESLKESEERLRIAVQSGRMYAFDWDVNSDRETRSAESADILGMPAEEIPQIKKGFIQGIHPSDRQQYLDTVRSLTPETPTYKAVFRRVCPDDTFIWLQESGRAFFNPDGRLERVIGITADVTETRQSEHALRELSGRLINSQEDERRRVARELHDNIGQELALLAVQAQRVDSGASDEERTTRADIHEVYKRIKDIATKVSTLSHRLHSSELDFLGLGIAAERLCRDFSQQFGLDVDQDIKELPLRLDSAVSLCFYRILQEALQNVAKHSAATRVLVQLSGSGGRLRLRIKDNGKGFDIEKVRFETGLGIVSMRERINLVGGQLAIDSKLGTGTELTASVSISG